MRFVGSARPDSAAELMQTASEANTKEPPDCLDRCLITAPAQTDKDVTPSAAPTAQLFPVK